MGDGIGKKTTQLKGGNVQLTQRKEYHVWKKTLSEPARDQFDEVWYIFWTTWGDLRREQTAELM